YDKGTDVFNCPWKVHNPQFNGTEYEVFIAGSDAAANTKIGLVIKHIFIVFSDHCHLSESKGSHSESQYAEWCKGDGLGIKMKSFCAEKAVSNKVTQAELIVDVQGKAGSLVIDHGIVCSNRLSDQ